MSDASIELTWADGSHKFRLALGQLRELQDKCNAGAIEILDRMSPKERKWYVDDVREIIRLGLIGGGKTPTEALVLTTRYVDARPIMENHMTAFLIIAASMAGVPGDQPLKKTAEEPTIVTDGSASPQYTEQEPSWAGLQEMSINSAFGSSP